MRVLVVLLGITVLFHGQGAKAAEPPPLGAYGLLPLVSTIAISPEGDYAATLNNADGRELAIAFSTDPIKIRDAIDVSAAKSRSIYFVSDRFAILRATRTVGSRTAIHHYEYSAAFSWDVEMSNVVQLLGENKMIYPHQSGLGRIVGMLPDGNHVLMPAYFGKSNNAPYFLLKVNLKTGESEVYERGLTSTIDWLVSAAGKIIAREDFNDKRNEYSIWDYRHGSPREIFSEKAKIPKMAIVGVMADTGDIIVSGTFAGKNYESLARLMPDGTFVGPVFNREDADIERILYDINRVIYGVEYSGLRPSYEMVDGSDPIASARTQFPGAAITIIDWTEDFKKLMLYVAGGDKAPAFYLHNRTTGEMTLMAREYNGIPDDQLGRVEVRSLKMRDGMKIPALLTLPPGKEHIGPFPTIVMPHGGPEDYDSVGFDWKAQFFASRGYAVLQPNFRGSDGFGAAFQLAGRGEWGRGVMQHDVTDSLKALIAEGVADPDKVCIVGFSYGGYSALAGGAFTPELYKCVAAVAPVTNLPKMIDDERLSSGRSSWVVTYWTKLMGDDRKEREKLKNISPVNFASEFRAPVLLIHGWDDTVVPIEQSILMKNALEKAGKDVLFEKVPYGDHWLSTSASRLRTLIALDAFVAKHIGNETAAESASVPN